MAEAFLNQLGGDSFEAESAGLEPGTLNPTVVQVMAEAGVDIHANKTKGVFDLLKQGKSYDCVITVCDETSAERCPVFPGRSKRLHWSFADPSSFAGTEEERKEKTRQVRDQIKSSVGSFIQKASQLSFWME